MSHDIDGGIPGFQSRLKLLSWGMPKLFREVNSEPQRFGSIVNRLRRERGMTLAHIARVTGMHAKHLGVLEQGGNVPSLTTILSIARALGVEAAEIIREVEQTAPRRRVNSD